MQHFIQIALSVYLIFCIDTKALDDDDDDISRSPQHPQWSLYSVNLENTEDKEKKDIDKTCLSSGSPRSGSVSTHETALLLGSQQDTDAMEKRKQFAQKATKFFTGLEPHEFGLSFNPFNIHPDVVSTYCLGMYDDFLRESTDTACINPTFVQDTVHKEYYQQLDREFFQEDSRLQILARRIVGVSGGFFASSAACALFMKFVADYFEIHTSPEASLGTVIFLCATISPFIMMQLSESTNEFFDRIQRMCSQQRESTGFYFKRDLPHHIMHALTHILSLGKALIIARVVYTIEQPYGGWAYPFTAGVFLSQYESIVRLEITRTNRLAQKHEKKFFILRKILLEKLNTFEKAINSSKQSLERAYEQIYPEATEAALGYSRLLQFFLPIRSQLTRPVSINEAYTRQQAHFSNEAADFVQNFSSLPSFSLWQVPTKMCESVISSFGSYGRFLIYGHSLTPLLSPPIAYTASALITGMQMYSENTIHQKNSDYLIQNLSKFTNGLRNAPYRTLASTAYSAVQKSPMILPIVAVAALSSVFPVVGKDALTDQEPTIRDIILISTGLLDFSVLTSLIQHTAVATRATAVNGIMMFGKTMFGRCFGRIADRLQHHTKKTQLQERIAKARNLIETDFNNDTIEVISTLVRKEEGEREGEGKGD